MKLNTTLATLSALALLGVTGAMANGTQPDTPLQPASPQQQVSPPQVAPGVPMAPVWVQLPAAGSYPYFLATPQPVPAYPLPQMTLPSGWGPFVMVWVPVQALQAASIPPVVDYGPVAETPVVMLPEPDPEPAPQAAATGETQPAVALPVPADMPAASPGPDGAAVPAVAPEAATPPLEQAVAESVQVSVPATDVDYGPVAPTPVVELPDFTAPPAVAAPAQPPATVKKKPVVRKKPVSKAPAAATPARKRMCWNNGVVAPCR